MTSRSTARKVVGILIALLVPVLIAAAFTTTLAHPARHFDDVVAAVVNNDEPVELEGQIVPLGRQLAAALVEGQGLDGVDVEGEGQNYDWVMTNADLARAGLESGEYGAVVTIPPDFSAAATSTAEMDASARQALIEVTVSPRARLADEAITHTIVRAALASLGNELTSTFLDNIFVGFNTLGDELGTAADGARALADGAQELADGANQLASGTGELAAGAGELAAGTGAFAGGAHALADGLDQLATGTGELAGGTGDLLTGVGALRSGTRELSDGGNELASGARQLADGTREYARGVDQFSAGLGELTGGAGELAGGLGELNDALSVVPEYLDTIETGLISGAGDVRDFAAQLAGQAGTIERIIDEICAADPDGDACLTLREHLGGSEQLDEFLGQAAAGLDELAGYMEGIGGDAGLGQIQQLFTAIDQLAGGAGELAGGLVELHAASEELATGAHGLADGNDDLADGLAEFAGGVGELDSGVGDLQAGVGELNSGAGQLASASRGAAAGAGELALGASDLAAGTSTLAGGAQDLAQGSEEFAAGTGELAGGTDELADGLGQAVDEIPNYSDGTRETLAETIANPLALSDTGGTTFRWLAVFSVIALWAGGLWPASVYPVVSASARTSIRSASSLTFASLKAPAVIAAAQGIAVGALVGAFGGVTFPVAAGFGVLAVLMSLVFMAVQRGLVAVLGRGGVALTVTVAAFAVATALISAMPAFTTAVVSWSPLGPAIRAVQALEASTTGLGGAVLGLLAWGAAGLVALVLATRRAQNLDQSQLAW